MPIEAKACMATLLTPSPLAAALLSTDTYTYVMHPQVPVSRPKQHPKAKLLPKSMTKEERKELVQKLRRLEREKAREQGAGAEGNGAEGEGGEGEEGAQAAGGKGKGAAVVNGSKGRGKAAVSESEEEEDDGMEFEGSGDGSDGEMGGGMDDDEEEESEEEPSPAPKAAAQGKKGSTGGQHKGGRTPAAAASKPSPKPVAQTPKSAQPKAAVGAKQQAQVKQQARTPAPAKAAKAAAGSPAAKQQSPKSAPPKVAVQAGKGAKTPAGKTPAAKKQKK